MRRNPLIEPRVARQRERARLGRRRFATTGFSMIELLVAVLVMSIGVLGIAALQMVSLQNNRAALVRAEAVALAYDMMDRIRVNPLGTPPGAAYDGIGIDAEDLPRLFNRFVQLQSPQSRAHPGTGLGLALSRHLVELHGGRIRAESPGAGLGSTFTFVIPIEDRS